jgi:iron complex transport system substrate-binding protein
MRRATVAAVLLLALSLAGCGPSRPAATALEPVDGVERVISLVPALTEITFALGAGERLVGVSDYCEYPAEAREKPRVGALISIDYEHLLRLRPEVILIRPEQRDFARRLGELGIGSVSLELQSIEDIRKAIERLGQLYGLPERAEELVASIDAQLEAVAEQSARIFGDPDRPDDERWRPRVLFIVGRNPGTLQQMYAAGSGSFVGELIEAAGGRNALGETSLPWPVISKESILALDPDIIIDGSYLSGGSSAEADALVPWQQLGTLRAVVEGRVVPIADDHMLIPGSSVAAAAERLAGHLRRAFPERGRLRGEPSPAPDAGAAGGESP